MYAKVLAAAQALSLVLGALLLSPTGSTAGERVHAVRGHGIFALTPPALIDQITINASVDASGAVSGSVAVWMSTGLYQSVPDYAGWIWLIRVDTLNVTGNVAQIGGIVVFDNRFPHLNVGRPIGFTVVDNGSGASEPPDELGIFWGGGAQSILGGNFTVR